MIIHRFHAFALAAILSPFSAQADVKLPALISNGMVLQKAAKVPVWGWAEPGEEVTVALNGQTVTAKTAADRKWKVLLNLSDSKPGPFELTVKGRNSLAVSDVLVGEVWVGSGQSNMGFQLKTSIDAEEEIARSANSLIRYFNVKRATPAEPQEDTEGTWVKSAPETSGDFSAVAYHFSKSLQGQLGLPVGVIHTSWGGTPSEAWTSREAIDSVPDLKTAREKIWPELVRQDEYQKSKTDYISALDAWIKANGREDKPTTVPAPFAGESVAPEGWIPVEIPGMVATPGLPETGVIWLRREIDIPKQPEAGLSLLIPLDGFDSVYWNGKFIASTPLDKFTGLGTTRRYGPYTIPQSLIKPGRNVMAIRLYQPAGPAKFTGEPKAGPHALKGSWMAKAEISFPALDDNMRASLPQPPKAPTQPQYIACSLFNGMVRPVIPYALRGVIWYQGESNAGRAWQYRTAFPLLINDWRKHWDQGDFPFYFCQLANYMEKTPDPGAPSPWAELREAQSVTLSLPNTGQAVLVDIGETADIHPRNKKDAGERLALIALARDYGKSVSYSGPVYDKMKVDGSRVVLSFRHADGGLVAVPLPQAQVLKSLSHETAPLVRNSPKSQLEGFAICGADQAWHWADAKIEGTDVVVQSEKVPAPMAVRYAWANNPTCNLANGKGLPASPFRTDDFPASTLNGKY